MANTFLAKSFKCFLILLCFHLFSEVHCHFSVYFHCSVCMIRKLNVWKCSRGGAVLTRLLLSIASVMSRNTQLIELVLFSTHLWHVLIHPPYTLTRVNWVQCDLCVWVCYRVERWCHFHWESIVTILDCNITAFTGRQNNEASLEQMRKWCSNYYVHISSSWRSRI